MSRHRRQETVFDEAVQRPSLDDPLVAEASEVVGGPIGSHAAGHPWWTPVRVVLAAAVVTFLLGMVQKTPCAKHDWLVSDAQRYGAMCYSDIPALYGPRGFAELVVPFTDTGGKYPDLEYPVVIGYFAYGAALITHVVSGSPDLGVRQRLSADEQYRAPGVTREAARFFDLTAMLLAVAALGAAYFMAGAHRGRPWDAMAYAASPALAVAGLINWDYLAILAVAGAMYFWARGRPVASGVLIGLGTATKLYPVFLLGAILVVCLRRGRLPAFRQAAFGAAIAWLAVDLPAILLGFEHWKSFWSFNQQRGADLGSGWLLLQQATNHTFDIVTVNRVSEIVVVVVCVGVLVLGMLAPRPPRIAQLAFLLVCGFLLVNKVYSPQYVMWLLPLAVLARPRWRDLLVWQAAELFYFGAIWLYLGKFTEPAAASVDDHVYWAAIIVRMAGELWLAALVVRDVLQPWHDPVRADGITDDPMEPVAVDQEMTTRSNVVAV